MLDHEDRKRLEKIAEQCRTTDARFVEGLQLGVPTSPREYRIRSIATVSSAGVALLLIGMLAGAVLLIVLGAAACAVGIGLFSCRALDRPRGRP